MGAVAVQEAGAVELSEMEEERSCHAEREVRAQTAVHRQAPRPGLHVQPDHRSRDGSPNRVRPPLLLRLLPLWTPQTPPAARPVAPALHVSALPPQCSHPSALAPTVIASAACTVRRAVLLRAGRGEEAAEQLCWGGGEAGGGGWRARASPHAERGRT